MRVTIIYILLGTAAGAVNGLLGAGGGLLLVPLLTLVGQLPEEEVFPSSVAVMLPICITSLCISPGLGHLPWQDAWPYMLAAVPGGIFAGLLDKKIPVKWLHRSLGLLILWGGIRYLC
ncbi:MAG: sulfite exporter TauE/SafE family protein [Ruminococcaceae bacterium]|nr:sulfite exporter TauE/SafE family protein [Oscillospiraceae bacterium]